MKATSLTRRLSVFALFGMMALVSCGPKTSTVSSVSSSPVTSASASTSSDGGFSFNPVHQSTESTSPSTASTSQELIAYNLADINMDKDYLVEAENCDTSNCTLQPLCQGFIEDPGEQFPTSNGECIACVIGPSILAFKFNAQADCTIQFFVTCARYEPTFNLDLNVQYYVDSETPFVSGYTAFDHTEANPWYNWKKVPLGTMEIKKGLHQFNAKVAEGRDFPNTDCFNLLVTNYNTAA